MSVQDYNAFGGASSLRELPAWIPVQGAIDGESYVPPLVTCNFFSASKRAAGHDLIADPSREDAP
jgi:hypothetical protein